MLFVSKPLLFRYACHVAALRCRYVAAVDATLFFRASAMRMPLF